jgi:uncharacterized membrane protein YciS (DUF1049 family)
LFFVINLKKEVTMVMETQLKDVSQVSSRFMPVIDLNSPTTTDLVVRDRFALAEKKVEENFVSEQRNSQKKIIDQTWEIIGRETGTKKLNSVLVAIAAIGGAIGLGYMLMHILAGIVSAGLVLGSAVSAWWFFKYKLPVMVADIESKIKIQANARISNEIIRLKQIADNEKIALRQIEIDYLKKIQLQAEENPIETLNLELVQMLEEQKAVREGATILQSEYSQLRDTLDKDVSDNKGGDFDLQKEQLAELKKICDSDENRLKQHVSATDEMKKILKESTSKWNFTQRLNKALLARDKALGVTMQREILATTALSKIKKDHADLFANIRTRAVELSAASSVKIGGLQIDVSSISLNNQPISTTTKE